MSELKRFPHFFLVWFAWYSQATTIMVFQVQKQIVTQVKAPFITVHHEFKCIA